MTMKQRDFRLEPDGPAGLAPMEPDLAGFRVPPAAPNRQVCHADDAIGLSVRVRGATAMRDTVGRCRGDEFPCAPDGSVPAFDGVEDGSVAPGDVFFVPAGTIRRRDVPRDLRKYDAVPHPPWTPEAGP
ncbi:MAG: hypothetical protein NXH83_14005 [Rhodobacteraceae bacterium]|nr:hypothetical protein [Paracoccaceae bacterium]